MHHEPWLTAFFNDRLAGIGNTINGWAGRAPQDRPWETFIVMELLVALIIVILFAVLRPKLSMEKPGKLQHLFEEMYDFLHKEAHDNIGHHSSQYVPLLGAIFVFILFANLLGVIPTFESPTMFPAVPLGIALVSFLFYNAMGVKEQGGKYFAQFLGPIPALAPLMIPIEIVTSIMLSNIHYLLRKTATHDKVIEKLKMLLKIIDVIITDKKAVEDALDSEFKDFEDALQNFSAQNTNEIKIIITRNTKDYKTSKLSIMNPETYLKTIQ